ncbi:hypothetical protein C1N92_20360 [Bacillus velezensis]|uniref:hypothetical protein n=1 Tax=Bacillus TaxID=1386 RepID=UPI000CF13EB9|nr:MULTISPECIES: hypothetical protein [Bacillus]AWQ17056.1 hypothetical protein C1N92_20360 [Bacillus velezensis]MBR7816770.1 hypothetical protein [Bacillus sp. CCNWLCWHY013]MCM3278277.1 hypothetical protein [Bacillus velezensis]MCM3351397.1 hypothetical protein [Bacillus velezensis]MCV4328510.1 hypothetical protein [Bacillus velezensis]
MNEKERMQKNIVEGIITAFNKLRVSIGDKCAYTSYLTKELLQKKYGINAELKAGELIFNPMILPLVYRWDPPYEFHMWVKLDDEIIDIAPVGITQRQEFEDGGVYFKYRDVCIPVVWEKKPYDGRRYSEVENGVKQIEPPVDEDIYQKLYQCASDFIDERNNRLK